MRQARPLDSGNEYFVKNFLPTNCVETGAAINDSGFLDARTTISLSVTMESAEGDCASKTLGIKNDMTNNLNSCIPLVIFLSSLDSLFIKSILAPYRNHASVFQFSDFNFI